MLTLDGKAYKVFQSTPPARGATQNVADRPAAPNHFNPRPPRGGATVLSRILATVTVISIHAPREGGDPRMQRL